MVEYHQLSYLLHGSDPQLMLYKLKGIINLVLEYEVLMSNTVCCTEVTSIYMHLLMYFALCCRFTHNNFKFSSGTRINVLYIVALAGKLILAKKYHVIHINLLSIEQYWIQDRI